MNIDPLINTNFVIISHVVVALSALLTGAVQLILKKGTPLHRHLGRLWVLLIAVVAISSFGIHEIRLIGPFSPIHLLSVFTLYSLWSGVRQIRRGDVAGHKKSMVALYIYAMLLTGSLTLLPGRIMHQVVFG